MKTTETEKQLAAAAIADFLSEVQVATRREILKGATKAYGLTEEELQSRDPNGAFVRARSTLGAVLTELSEKGSVKKDGVYYFLGEDRYVIVRDAQCEAQIHKLLMEKPYDRNELYSALMSRFGTDRTQSKADDLTLRQLAQRAIKRMRKRGEIKLSSDGKKICSTACLSASEQLLSETEVRKALFGLLFRRGGAFFERFLANLLEKYFLTTGRDVTFCDVKGGSSDGGIDVVVDTVDELGFSEHILIQAKCRERIHVTEKEVREFYGALHAQNGSRGIFVTTSTFHSGAKKLLDSLDNCVGIDGDKLFEMIKQTSYGIIRLDDGYAIDAELF